MQSQQNNQNKDITAQPKTAGLGVEKMEYTKANLQDAKASGYTDQNGHAIEMARPDVEGHPTGAFTDIGAGRSSVVKTNAASKMTESDVKGVEERRAAKKTVETEALTPGEEQAP